MKNLKRAAAVTMMAGGLVAAGAGLASATDCGKHHDHTTGHHAQDHVSAQARGKAVKSPGVASGNTVLAPVHIPVNAVGNTATVIGGLNPAFGNLGLNP